MGEIRPKKCEPRELTKDQLVSPQKARVLLMLALHALGPAPSFAELSRVFATY